MLVVGVGKEQQTLGCLLFQSMSYGFHKPLTHTHERSLSLITKMVMNIEKMQSFHPSLEFPLFL